MMDEIAKAIQEWRHGAGADVRFVAYYGAHMSFDGYTHHTIFEVDDVSQVRAIREYFARFANDRLAIDVVKGRPEVDDLWTS